MLSVLLGAVCCVRKICYRAAYDTQCPSGKEVITDAQQLEKILKNTEDNIEFGVINDYTTIYKLKLDTIKANAKIDIIGLGLNSIIEIFGTGEKYKYFSAKDIKLKFNTTDTIFFANIYISNCTITYLQGQINLIADYMTTQPTDLNQFKSVTVNYDVTFIEHSKLIQSCKIFVNASSKVSITANAPTNMIIEPHFLVVRYPDDQTTLTVESKRDIRFAPKYNIEFRQNSSLTLSRTGDRFTQTAIEVTAVHCKLNIERTLKRATAFGSIRLIGAVLSFKETDFFFPLTVSGNSELRGPSDIDIVKCSTLNLVDGFNLNLLTSRFSFTSITFPANGAIKTGSYNVTCPTWIAASGKGLLVLDKIIVTSVFYYGGTQIRIKGLQLDGVMISVTSYGWKTREYYSAEVDEFYFDGIKFDDYDGDKTIKVGWIAASGNDYKEEIEKFLDDSFFGNSRFYMPILKSSISFLKAVKYVPQGSDATGASPMAELNIDTNLAQIICYGSPKSISQSICISNNIESSHCASDSRRFYSPGSSNWAKTVTNFSQKLSLFVDNDEKLNFSTIAHLDTLFLYGKNNTITVSWPERTNISQLYLSKINVVMEQEARLSLNLLGFDETSYIKNADFRDIYQITHYIKRVKELVEETDISAAFAGNDLREIYFDMDSWKFLFSDNTFVEYKPPSKKRLFLSVPSDIDFIALTCNNATSLAPLSIKGTRKFMIRGIWPGVSEPPVRILENGPIDVDCQSQFLPIAIQGEFPCKPIRIRSEHETIFVSYVIRSYNNNFFPIFESSSTITASQYSVKYSGCGIGSSGIFMIFTSTVNDNTDVQYSHIIIQSELLVRGNSTVTLYDSNISTAVLNINIKANEMSPRITGYGNIIPKEIKLNVENGALERGKKIPLLCFPSSQNITKVPPIYNQGESAKIFAEGNCLILQHNALALPMWSIITISIMAVLCFVGIILIIFLYSMYFKVKKKRDRRKKLHTEKKKRYQKRDAITSHQ